MKFREVSSASFYKVIDEFWKCDEDVNKRPVHRLFSLMRKMNAKSLVFSPLLENSPIVEEELAALRGYFGEDLLEVECKRISFFSKLYSVENDVFLCDENSRKNSALSDVVLISFQLNSVGWRSYIFRALVAIPFSGYHGKKRKALLNNYIHCSKTFEFTISKDDRSIDFEIYGSFFCQQNGFTSECYTASICMILNNYTKREIICCPEDINKFLGIDHKTKKVSDYKFYTEELYHIFKNYGLETRTIDPKDSDPDFKFSESLYPYLECREPALLVFSTHEEAVWHVVPVVGHTLNTDLWHPEAERQYEGKGNELYRSAASWVDHFIVHDDNFGMFQCMPVDFVNKKIVSNHDAAKECKELKCKERLKCYAARVVVLKPDSVTTKAEFAKLGNQTIFEFICDNIQNVAPGMADNYWLKKLISVKHNNGRGGSPLVVERTFISSRHDYMYHLSSEDSDGKTFSSQEIEMMVAGLPDTFFVTEMSLPDLYTVNKSKIAEFIYSAQVSADEQFKKEMVPENWLQARLPGLWVVNRSSGEWESRSLSVEGHFPIFRDCCTDENLYSYSEW